MATLAASTPSALIAPCDAPSFGTGAQSYNGSDLHGQDFKTLRDSMLGIQRRNSELAAKLIDREAPENFSYSAPPPLRTYYVDAILERGGEILPVPFDFEED